MSAWSKTFLYGLSFRFEENPVFPFHTLPRGTLQCAVDFEPGIAAIVDHLIIDQVFKFSASFKRWQTEC